MKKFGALLLTALAGSCVASATLTRQHNPKSEIEAGAVTISASAPMAWEDVVGELRPEFNSATARAYVDTAIATTQQDFSSRREATSVQLGVDVSGQTTQSSQTTETTAAGTTTTGRTVESQSAAAPLRRTDGGQVVDGTIAAPANNVFSGADRPAQWPEGARGSETVDPILRYRAAVALHQELVLLDNYLDSAYDPCLQEAWLVRTRLVATPYARNQPIDAYSRIYASYRQGDQVRWSNDGIRLVPLLVTDNFERSDSRRYEQLASQVQASLNGVSGVVAAGLGFNRYLNNLNAILGSQYNNLLTIAQIEDYSLMVRLGAAFSPTSRYEMQSRSYDITFLVVIDKGYLDPRGPISLGFFAETEMRDAVSGELLQAVRPEYQRHLLDEMDDNEPEEGGLGLDAWRNVRAAIESGIASRVTLEDVQGLLVPDELRSELVRWFLASYGSTAAMPVGRGRVALPEPQDGVFRDSLAGGLRARVVGPPGLNSNQFRAELLVVRADQSSLTFAASSVAVNAEGVIDALFPSLGALGINSDNTRVRLRLTRQCPTSNRDEDSRDTAQVTYPLLRDRAILVSAPGHAVSFQAEPVGEVRSITVSGPQSVGDARIRLRAINERNNPYVARYEIQVTGALLQRARRLGDGGAEYEADQNTNAVRVGPEFGSYNLSFSRLAVGTPVKVKVVGLDAQGALVSAEEVAIPDFTVVQQPANQAPGGAPG